jgi:hypothetical protein
MPSPTELTEPKKEYSGYEAQTDLKRWSDPFLVKGVLEKKSGGQEQDENPDAEEYKPSDGGFRRCSSLGYF